MKNRTLVRIVILIQFYFVAINCHGQNCVINLTHESLDGLMSNNSKTEGACIKYKSKGKSRINIFANDTLVESLEIIDNHLTEEYNEVTLLNEYGVIMVYRFFLKKVELEIIVKHDGYKIIESGDGLSYKIRKRLKGTGKSLPPVFEN